MASPKSTPIKRSILIGAQDDAKADDILRIEEVIRVDSPVAAEDKFLPLWPVHPRPVLPGRIAVVGNYLPRKCGIATFTADLCDAIHAEYGATELLALPVNDTAEGYDYPARIRFELSRTIRIPMRRPRNS